MHCINSQNGKLAHKDLGKVWADFPESLHQWLLRLTEEYDLTFPLHDKPINLVPCLLPERHAEIQWPELKDGERQTKMVYNFAYLPSGLFNRAQVQIWYLLCAFRCVTSPHGRYSFVMHLAFIQFLLGKTCIKSNEL